MSGERSDGFPLGAAVTLEELDADPHAVHHRLRPSEPVSWLPCLDGWLVTSHALASAAMRDPATFTVDDPRFTTARVIGPSMLSLDGAAHDQHRAPFAGPFRAASVSERFAWSAAERARTLVAELAPRGRAELRREFAGRMAAATIATALGMDEAETGEVLAWYDAIVASVSALSAARPDPRAVAGGASAFATLRERLQPVISGTAGDSLLAAAAHAAPQGSDPGANPDGRTPGPHPGSCIGSVRLSDDEIASNAAVLLFGGIETTEGMIANAALEILTHVGEPERIRADPAALDAVIDESLRREPAAAVVDRYATRELVFGGAPIAAGELVRISLAGAGRDPAVFPDPDAYDPTRANLRRHLAFARGPHVCVGVHLARLEARAALGELLTLPGLRLDPEQRPDVRGLVFRKPVALHARWTARRTASD
ncbi:MAG TPA: cytochrome P450 [Solirubrobacteraceae bacterium]|nr:cytochrome P450 [Solirubrobacteraceae bacterium]